MALYMDIHHIPDGVALADVVQAHKADLAVQGEHGVDYRRFWVDEQGGTIFCLVEAPSAQAAANVHEEAHGLVADQIFRVQEGQE